MTRETDPLRWKRIQELLDELMDLDAAARTARLNEACVGDDELRREVESLLQADSKAAGFLDESVADFVAPALADGLSIDLGERIGVRTAAARSPRLQAQASLLQQSTTPAKGSQSEGDYDGEHSAMFRDGKEHRRALQELSAFAPRRWEDWTPGSWRSHPWPLV